LRHPSFYKIQKQIWFSML